MVKSLELLPTFCLSQLVCFRIFACLLTAWGFVEIYSLSQITNTWWLHRQATNAAKCDPDQTVEKICILPIWPPLYSQAIYALRLAWKMESNSESKVVSRVSKTDVTISLGLRRQRATLRAQSGVKYLPLSSLQMKERSLVLGDDYYDSVESFFPFANWRLNELHLQVWIRHPSGNSYFRTTLHQSSRLNREPQSSFQVIYCWKKPELPWIFPRRNGRCWSGALVYCDIWPPCRLKEFSPVLKITKIPW